MKGFCKALLSAVFIATIPFLAHAENANTFNITLNTLQPANQITNVGYSIISYQVQNIGTGPVYEAYMQPITGITQFTTSGVCGFLPLNISANTCGVGNPAKEFYLNPGQSCELLLCVEGPNMVASNIQGGPTICALHDNPKYCDNPAGGANLNIALVPGNNISVSPNPTIIASNPVNPTTVQWTITNLSNFTVFDIYPVEKPPTTINLQNIDYADCHALAPNGQPGDTCTISASIAAGHPAADPNVIGFAGANVAINSGNQVNTSVYVDPGLTITGTTNFTDATTYTITIKNITDVDISNIVITTPTIPGVNFHTSGCSATLAQGATCDITATVGTDALPTQSTPYVLTVTYSEAGEDNLTVSTVITVADTELIINGGLQGQPGNPIELSLDTPELDVIITNAGNFNWQNPTFQLTNAPAGVSLDYSDCAAGSIPSEDCTIKFKTSDITTLPPVSNATLTISGDNLQPVTTLVNLQNITIAVDPSFRHLQYQRVLVLNQTGAQGPSVEITGIALTGLGTSEAIVCDSASTNCDGYNANDPITGAPMCAIGDVIPPQSNSVPIAQASCYVLIKSITDITEPYNNNLAGALTIQLKNTADSTQVWNAGFKVQQQQQLYIAGSFDTAIALDNSQIPARSIAAWNGKNNTWTPLSQGLIGGTGSALLEFKGDLYAGGAFLAAGNSSLTSYLAVWNGDSWARLGSGTSYTYIADGPVKSLLVDPTSATGAFFVGGQFTHLNQITKSQGKEKTATTVVDGLAYWDPTNNQLTPVHGGGATFYGVSNGFSNTGINAMTYYVDNSSPNTAGLFVGGDFVNALSDLLTTTSNNVARLQNTTAGWFSLTQTNTGLSTGPGLSANALLLATSNNLYVGGTFTQAGPVTTNNVAVWFPSTSTWGAGANEGLDNTVNSLTMFAGNLYAAGAFTHTGDGVTSLNYFAQLDGINWVQPTGADAIDGTLLALYTFNGAQMFIGGQYNSNNNIYNYDGTTLTGVANGVRTINPPGPASVNAMVVASSINILAE